MPQHNRCPSCNDEHPMHTIPRHRICDPCLNMHGYPTTCDECGKPLPPMFRFIRHHSCDQEARY